MSKDHKAPGLLDPAILFPAMRDAVVKLDPRKLLRNPEAQRTGKAAMMENPGVNSTRHQRLCHRHLLGFPPDDGPNAIKTRDTRLRLGQSCAPMAVWFQPI